MHIVRKTILGGLATLIIAGSGIGAWCRHQYHATRGQLYRTEFFVSYNACDNDGIKELRLYDRAKNILDTKSNPIDNPQFESPHLSSILYDPSWRIDGNIPTAIEGRLDEGIAGKVRYMVVEDYNGNNAEFALVDKEPGRR